MKSSTKWIKTAGVFLYAIIFSYLVASVLGSYFFVATGSHLVKQIILYAFLVGGTAFLVFNPAAWKLVLVLLINSVLYFCFHAYVGYAVNHWGYRASQQIGLESAIIFFLIATILTAIALFIAFGKLSSDFLQRFSKLKTLP